MIMDTPIYGGNHQRASDLLSLLAARTLTITMHLDDVLVGDVFVGYELRDNGVVAHIDTTGDVPRFEDVNHRQLIKGAVLGGSVTILRRGLVVPGLAKEAARQYAKGGTQ